MPATAMGFVQEKSAASAINFLLNEDVIMYSDTITSLVSEYCDCGYWPDEDLVNINGRCV